MKKFLAAGIASLMLLQSCAGATSAIINPTVNNNLPSAYKPLPDSEIDRLYKISMNTLSKYSTMEGLYSAGEVSSKIYFDFEFNKMYVPNHKDFNEIKFGTDEEVDILETDGFDWMLYDVDYIEQFFNKTYLSEELINYYKTGAKSEILNSELNAKKYFDIVNGEYKNNITKDIVSNTMEISRAAYISAPNIPLLVKDGITISDKLKEINLKLNLKSSDLDIYNLNIYFYDSLYSIESKSFEQDNIDSGNDVIFQKTAKGQYITDFNPLKNYYYKKAISLKSLSLTKNESNNIDVKLNIDNLLNEGGIYLPKIKNLSSKIGVSLSLSDNGLLKIRNEVNDYVKYFTKNKDVLLKNIDNDGYLKDDSLIDSKHMKSVFHLPFVLKEILDDREWISNSFLNLIYNEERGSIEKISY